MKIMKADIVREIFQAVCSQDYCVLLYCVTMSHCLSEVLKSVLG